MFESLLKKSNGANYYLTDLHIHTPSDKRFKCPKGVDPSTEAGRKEIATSYVKAALGRGVKLIAITEHNDVSWIDPIREAARGTELTVFPGIELSADSGSGGIHVIALFEPNTDITTLDDLITQLGLPRKERFHSDGTPKLSNKSLSDLVDFITVKGGVCIAAHVSGNHGILKDESMKGEPRVKAWANPKLVAAELPKKRSELSGFERNVFDNVQDLYKRERPIAALYSSDARSVDEIGKQATLIKLSSRTLEGLKQAFLDWESRIRHPDELPPSRFSKVIAVQWEGGFLDGLQIHFNGNLNCLIGGKGTGKSTVLESLRFAFGDDFVPRAEKAREQHEQILKEVFRRGSKVSILIEAHDPTPKKYIIERIYNSPPIIRDEGGKLLPQLKPADVFALEVYGQKEIYEISKNSQFQLSLVDRFIGGKLDKLVDDERDIEAKLQSSTTEYVNMKQQVERLQEQIQRLPRLKEQLQRYKQSGMPERLREKTQYEKERNLLGQVREKLTKVKTTLEKTKASSFLSNPIPEEKALEGLPNKKALQQVSEVIGSCEKGFEKSLEAMRKDAEDAEKSVFGEGGVYKAWEAKYRDQETRYQQLVGQLEKEFPGIDIENFLETESEIVRLEQLSEEKAQKDKEFQEIQSQRSVLLQSLYDNRREQFSIRDRECQEINKTLEGILRVSLAFEGDRASFLEKLKTLKSGAQQIERVVESDAFSIPTFIKAVQEGPQKVSELFGISETSATKLCAAISLEERLALESFKIGIRTTIELNIGSKEKPKFQGTAHLSVGQRCTAILTLILLESANPLLIDQPEDDLDNTFIFADIVRKLRKEKERRQFVVATHNANIPVLGDAELICVLTADAEHGGIKEGDCGSIDDERLRKPVEEILEGGKEAFLLRKQKYGF